MAVKSVLPDSNPAGDGETVDKNESNAQRKGKWQTGTAVVREEQSMNVARKCCKQKANKGKS